MKTAFVIAGFGKRADSDDFAELRKAIAAKGFRVVSVPFDWKYITISGYAKKFVKFYEQNKSEHNIVVGNSFGAVVSFITAPRLKPDKIVLCSLSAFFKENLARVDMERAVRRFGKRRIADFNKLSSNEIAKQIEQTGMSTIMMYGEQEKEIYPWLVESVKAIAEDIKQAEVVEAKGAPHGFRDPEYAAAITKVL